jgi:hypothetical protein
MMKNPELARLQDQVFLGALNIVSDISALKGIFQEKSLPLPPAYLVLQEAVDLFVQDTQGD